MPRLKIETLSERSGIQALAGEWNALVQADAAAPHGLDATSTFEWHAALLDAFLPGGDRWQVLVASDARGLAGILPLYWCRAGQRLPRTREIALLTELSGGRNGFLVREGDPAILRELLMHLCGAIQGWDSLRFHVTQGSRSERMLHAALRGTGCHCPVVGKEVSPILHMPEDLGAYLRTLKPGFRAELQRREKRLRAVGELKVEMVDTPGQVASYLAAVDEIERQSWKEGAGSSITARPWEHGFYKALLPRAAANGQLLSGLLSIDGRPVAYRMSVSFAGTAVALKSSYVQDMRAFAPATVLQWLYLREMHRRGIRVFDFTGLCEAHKTRWTDDTYTLLTHRLYRKSFWGRLAHLRQRLGARARRIAAIA
jgi:hypothetical protein